MITLSLPTVARKLLCGLALGTALIAGALAQEKPGKRPLSEADVQKMVELQLDDDLIIGEGRKRTWQFTVNEAFLERMKQAGASDAVLKYFRAAGQPAQAVEENLMVWVTRESDSYDASLHSELYINEKLVEVPAALPFQGSDQPKVHLVNECGRLQRLSRLLLSQLQGRQLAQFGVDQLQQLFRRARIARLLLRQDATPRTCVHSAVPLSAFNTERSVVPRSLRSHRPVPFDASGCRTEASWPQVWRTDKPAVRPRKLGRRTSLLKDQTMQIIASDRQRRPAACGR